MLQDLGDAEDMAAGQFLRGNLSLPLQSLLQRASPLTIEARIAGHQLRFPLHCTLAAEGHTELRIAAPTITELGSPHLRAWRLDEKAVLHTSDAEYEVHSLSLGGLIVAGLPPTLAKGDRLHGTLGIEGLPPPDTERHPDKACPLPPAAAARLGHEIPAGQGRPGATAGLALPASSGRLRPDLSGGLNATGEPGSPVSSSPLIVRGRRLPEFRTQHRQPVS